MLLRPPFIQEQDVKSQASNPISQMEREKSVKSTSKNKKKQNTIGMKKNTMIGGIPYNANLNVNENNYDSDNGSVHSVNSRKSKGKTKQSTIAIGKREDKNVEMNNIQKYSIDSKGKKQKQRQQYEIFQLQQNDDNKSIGSHVSRNSRKNTVKENSLGKMKNNQKVSVELNYYFDKNTKHNQRENKKQQSPRKYYMQEESKVQIVKLNDNTDTFTQPLKYNQMMSRRGPQVTAKNPQSRRRTQQPRPNNTKPSLNVSSSPFEEITLTKEEEYEEPVYRLRQEPVYKLREEPNEKIVRNRNNINHGNNFFQQNTNKNDTNQNFYRQNKAQQRQQQKKQNPFSQRNNPQVIKTTNNNNNEIKVDLQQSHTIMQPQMISTKSVTKSRRNKIFDNDSNSISNSSNIISSRTNANMEGSFEKSRSKSKSKLGDLLKGTREKQGMASKKEDVQENVNINPVQLGYKEDLLRKQTTANLIKLGSKPQMNQGNTRLNDPYTDNTSNYQPSIVGGQKLTQHQPKISQPIKRNNYLSQDEVFDFGDDDKKFSQDQQELNLSVSHKGPRQQSSLQQQQSVKGDSVLFNFEPERKRGLGLTITSKQKNSQSSLSKQNNQSSKSIESKKHLDRLMKKCQQNEQFLAKSILSSNSELMRASSSKRLIGINGGMNDNPNTKNIDNRITKKEENVNERKNYDNMPFQRIVDKNQQIPAWHQMVKNDAPFMIKEVQRKEIIRKPVSEQTINQPKKSAQNHKNQVMNAKPMSPAEFFRLQNQIYQQKQAQIQTKVQQQEKNKLLAQISKKSAKNIQEQKVTSPKNIIMQNPKNNYENIQAQSFFKSPLDQDDEEINLNYSDALDEKLISIKDKVKGKQIVKDPAQVSSLSHEFSLSENGSEKSNSQSGKKQRKKQSSLNIMKKHKVQVREQSPRAEESFYQEPPQKQQDKHQMQQQYQQKPSPKKQPYKQPLRINDIQSQQNSNDNTDRTFKLEGSKTKVDYKKPNLINFQQNEMNVDEEKIKSRTDVNFYSNFGAGDGSQRSIRPPSSKPPLSRKSNCSSSKSKSKAKQSTININPVKKETKIKQISSSTGQNSNLQQQEPKKKKRTLLQIAQEKQYQGSGYGGSDSQCSFNSRESFGSINSKNSRNSRKSSASSKKESTLPITIKGNNNKANTMNQFRPSLNKIPSTTMSQVEIFNNDNGIDQQSIYNNLQQYSMGRSRSRQRMSGTGTQSQTQFSQYSQQQQPYPQQRTIVSKDTYFIDERGRLVKKDLIIKGNQIYSQQSSSRTAEQMAMQRMRRSREHHRSRSKSRDGSRSRMSKKVSVSSMQESGYSESIASQSQSSNYYNNNSNYNYNNRTNQYHNNNYTQPQNPTNKQLYIEQFVKPIQQQPFINKRKTQQQAGYNFQKQQEKRNFNTNSKSYGRGHSTGIEREFYENDNDYENEQYYRNDDYQDGEDQDGEQVRHVTLSQLWGKGNNNKNNNDKNQMNTNNYKKGRVEQYPTANSRYTTTNNQQSSSSAMRQSSASKRKNSLSRTQKTFYNNTSNYSNTQNSNYYNR